MSTLNVSGHVRDFFSDDGMVNKTFSEGFSLVSVKEGFFKTNSGKSRKGNKKEKRKEGGEGRGREVKCASLLDFKAMKKSPEILRTNIKLALAHQINSQNIKGNVNPVMCFTFRRKNSKEIPYLFAWIITVNRS